MSRGNLLFLTFLVLTISSHLYGQKTKKNSNFLPSSIENLSLWFVADSLNINDNPISNWKNLANSNFDAVQDVNNHKPILVDSINALNNHSALRFDGNDDFLTFGELNNLRSIVFLIKHRTGSQSVPPLLGHESKYQFHGGDLKKLFEPDFINSGLKNGSSYVNGKLTPIGDIEKPIQYSIVSTISSKNLTASRITKDRGSNRIWDGDYVEIIAYSKELNENELDSINLYLRNKYAPPVNLGKNISRSNFCPFPLTLHGSYNSIKWSNGETSNSVMIEKPGKYWVEVTDIFGFKSYDTITINFPGNYLERINLCLGDSLKWNLELQHNEFDFLWQDGSKDSVFTILDTGKYYVEITDTLGCIFTSDTTISIIDSFSRVISLGSDTSFCAGSKIKLKSGNKDIASYLWNDSSTDSTLHISKTGNYWLKATNKMGCLGHDTIYVTVKGENPKIGFENSRICSDLNILFNDTSLTVDVNDSIKDRLWEIEGVEYLDKSPIHNFKENGIYNIKLTVKSINDCSSTIFKDIVVDELPIADFEIPTICKNKEVTFRANSNLKQDDVQLIEWVLRDENKKVLKIGNQRDLKYSFINEQLYQLKLLIKAQNGCTDSTTNYFRLNTKQECFLPSNIDSLILWFISDSVNTVDHVISNWKNLANSNFNATQDLDDSKPVLVDSIQVLNNHRALRFDGINDFLTFGEITNLRSIIFLIKHKSGIQSVPPLLGHESQYQFHGGESKKLFDPFLINPGLKNGRSFVNGQPTPIADINKPTQYSIISNISSQDLTASRITKDRGSNRVWDGDYVEIMAFTKEIEETDLDSINSYLRLKYAPPVNLGKDITRSNFCPFTLSVNSYFSNFNWSNGDTTKSIEVNKSGTYWVEATDIFGFKSYDTIVVKFPGSFLPDTSFCLNDTLIWNTNLSLNKYSFLWNDGSTDNKLQITSPGSYFLNITDDSNCKYTSDTINIEVDSFKNEISLGPDTTFCSGNKINLKLGAEKVKNYVWNDNSSLPYLTISQTGKYWLKVINQNGCLGTDTINILVKGTAPEIEIQHETLCEKDSFTLQGVKINNDTTQIINWLWKINDELFSKGQKINFFSNTVDTITISLTATNSAECTQKIKKNLVIHPSPKSNFKVSNGCNGDNLNLTDLSEISSGNIISWNWYFDDNTISSGKATTKNFSIGGSHIIQLKTVSDKNCKDSVTLESFVHFKPKSNFSYSKTCKNEMTEFKQIVDTSNIGAVKFLWDFGGGIFSSLPKTKHYFEKIGEFPVSLKVTRLDNLCFHDTTMRIRINDLPIANFEIDTLCIENPYEFRNTSTIYNDSIKEFRWYLEDSLFSMAKNPIINPKVSTIENFALHVTSYEGCSDSINQAIKVASLPILNFSFFPDAGLPPLPVNFTNLSPDTSLTFLWDFGDSSYSNEINPQKTYIDLGKYAVKLIGTNKFGCSDSLKNFIEITQPIVDIIVDDILIEPQLNNLLKISVKIINNGNLKIRNLNFNATLGDLIELSENWEGILEPNSVLIYHFNSSVNTTNLASNPKVCIEVNLVNNQEIETITINNSLCKSAVEEEFLLLPLKNPQSSTKPIEINLISATNQEVKFDFWNTVGEKTLSINETAHSGLNKFTFDLQSQPKGILIFRISSTDFSKTVKLVRN